MKTKRPTAGRPPSPAHLKRNTVTIRLPQWIIDYMDDRIETGTKSQEVERALIKLHGLVAPKDEARSE